MTMLTSGRARAAVAALLWSVVVGPLPAAAQTSAPSGAAEQALQAGLAAQQARRHPDAVAHLSRAISLGTLPRKQLTYALYRRAISHRAGKQPAQAISDLNSALYFKGDLSSSDRADAIEERMKAFRDAGLSATPVATASQASQWSPSLAPEPAAVTAQPSRVVTSVPPRVFDRHRTAPAPAPPPLTEPILGPATSAARSAAPQVTPPIQSDFRTRVAANARPAASAPAAFATAAAPSAAPSAALSYVPAAVDRGTGVSRASPARIERAPDLPKWDVATTASPRPATQYPATQNTVTQNTVTQYTAGALPPSNPPLAAVPERPAAPGFFSSIFGGGTPRPAPEPRPLVTASLPRPAAPAVTVPAAAAPAPTTPLARAPAGGKFEIQVAVLRSKDRAEALAQQLMVQYPGSFFTAAKKAHVTEAAGPEGPEYAVRFGVYESRDALTDQCTTFKNNGLDCEIVTP